MSIATQSPVDVDVLAKALLINVVERTAGVNVTRIEHQQHSVPELLSEITLTISVTDRSMYDIMTELREGIEIEMEDEPTAVQRPTTHSIAVGGVNNLEVKWDKEQGFFRLTSVCLVCGRSFERQLRGFVTKDLVVLAHELGYKLGEHLERHQSFDQYLAKLKRDDNEQ